MRSKARIALSLALMVCSLLAGDAWATHKSWELRDPGMNCISTTSQFSSQLEYVDGALINNGSAERTVSCPVTLAGKFGASGGNVGPFSVAQWPTAGWGDIWVHDGSTSGNVSCVFHAQTSTGSGFFSRSVSSSSTGSATLSVYDTLGDTWAGTIGNGTSLSVRALGYRCSLPNNSIIYGYRVNICQYNACDPDQQ
jgi:hypothetical protein